MSDPHHPEGPADAVAMLRALFAASRDAVGVTDEHGRVLMANPALTRMLGFDDESELVGRSLMERIAPGSREMTAEVIRRQAMDDSPPAAYQSRTLRRDGSELVVEVRTVLFSAGGARCSLGILRELPEATSPRPPQTSGDAFYRALFDVNTAVKLLIDPSTGQIVDANQAAVDMYGWSRDELLGMRIMDINTLTQEEVREEMNNARTGRRRYFRFRHRTATDDVRHVEVYSGPVELEGRQLLLSIVHDVTERDALEEQLRESRRLEIVGRLAGGVAHDFNNLITVMMSSSDMLLKRSDPESPLRPYLEDLSHTARRAADLTRDLLAFSRRQVIEPRPLELETLVTRVTGLLRRTLGAGYGLDSTVEEGLPLVMADAGQMEQVLMNLAINARDAMPEGGRLSITARSVEVGRDDRNGVPAGRWVALEVADEGEGMDEETRRRVFEPFFTTKGGSGSGLGLATVHGIVAQSGGHVTVESEVGRGSVFTVYLPPAPPGSTVEAPREPAAATRHHAGRILLVDDVPAVRAALARALRHAGFEVAVAASAAEALARSDDELEQLDAVVSDVVMPGKSGVDLARALGERIPDLPVVLISGELRDHDPATFPTTVRFVAKPFTSDQLAREIREAMRPQSSSPSGGAPPG